MAIAANEKILTLDYWKRADKLVEGDWVFDRAGNPCQITLVQHFPSQCYRVQLSDLMEVTGNGALNFQLETPKYRKRLVEYKGKRPFLRPLVLSPLKDLLDKPLRHKMNRHCYSIPTCGALKFPHQDLPVPPFLFGYWYWNRIRPNVFSSHELNTEEVIQKLKNYGYEIVGRKKKVNKHTHFSVFPTVESQFAPFIPTELPNNYLLASQEQRIELLSGIVNARPKQYKAGRDLFRICSTSWQEIRRMQALVESLGSKTTLNYNEKRHYYTLSFKSRHQLCSHQVSPPIKVHQSRRYITKIEELIPQQCVHIETNGLDGSFLVGEGFIACR
jgi:hypothetical protein